MSKLGERNIDSIMVERIKERGREREPEETLYDFNYRFRQDYLRKRREGEIVLRGRDRSWQESRQGLHKWFCNVKFWDQQAVPYWSMFIIRIKNHSGKHVHQGGLGLYVLEGKGYTVVDGVRYDWEKDDVIILPVKPEGCEHQHFNADPNGPPVEWIAFIFNPFSEAMGHPLEQKEDAPEWKGSTVPTRHVT
ncbi:MAG: hypothetical protein HW384_784 [Dehalococcoidia bacterium]|nr:hypothetical protein [Dehalococcoidia bacterium]